MGNYINVNTNPDQNLSELLQVIRNLRAAKFGFLAFKDKALEAAKNAQGQPTDYIAFSDFLNLGDVAKAEEILGLLIAINDELTGADISTLLSRVG